MYGIVPFDRHWNVAIKRNGLTFQKTFSHSTCGGRDAALSMAQAWRDEIVRTHPPVSRQEKAQRTISTNTSGIPGVSCSRWPDGSPRLWTAKTVVSSEKILNKSFSVGRFGDQAKLLAIEERQKQLLQLSGRTAPHPAEESVRASPPPASTLSPPAPAARARVVKRNNASGIPGVFYRKGVGGRSSQWIASTTPSGGPRITKGFSVREHGEDQAKALAIAERERQLKELADRFHRSPSQGTLRHIEALQGMNTPQAESLGD